MNGTIERVERPVANPAPTDGERQSFLNGMIYALRLMERKLNKPAASLWHSTTGDGSPLGKPDYRTMTDAVAEVITQTVELPSVG